MNIPKPTTPRRCYRRFEPKSADQALRHRAQNGVKKYRHLAGKFQHKAAT
jgi:hypothetical protein